MTKLTLNEIGRFKEFLMQEEKSLATVKKYIYDTESFVIWLEGRAVDKQAVLQYKGELMERYAPASVNSILSALNMFFEFLGLYECKVKILKIQRQIFANRDKELSKQEYEKLLKEAEKKHNKKLNLIMQTICSTGIRVSELNYITVQAVRNEKAVINCKGKMRVVILPKQLCKMLEKYIKEQKIETGNVFITKTGKPMDRSNIWKLMKSLCDKAGVSKEKVFPHNLRHLFARTYYSLQKDIVRLADILGHSSINTTRIYTMESGEVHRIHIQKLGLLRC